MYYAAKVRSEAAKCQLENIWAEIQTARDRGRTRYTTDEPMFDEVRNDFLSSGFDVTEQYYKGKLQNATISWLHAENGSDGVLNKEDSGSSVIVAEAASEIEGCDLNGFDDALDGNSPNE